MQLTTILAQNMNYLQIYEETLKYGRSKTGIGELHFVANKYLKWNVKMKSKSFFSLIVTFVFFFSLGHAAEPDTTGDFKFTILHEVPGTAVKNQASSGTCWSFAAVAFIESELLRMDKGTFDLSEMYFVRKIYPEKAMNYIRMHGTANIGPGSLFGDALRCIHQDGFVPESVYPGLPEDYQRYNHSELDAVLKASLDAIIHNRSRTINTSWPKLVNAILDIYLGELPQNFTYSNKEYTAASFAAMTGFNPENYIEITSYSHHPFYSEFVLEIPDNWAHSKYQNVPLDEFIEIINHALENGYSVGFDGDVSEKSFKHKLGVAILPEKDWEIRTKAEKDSVCKSPEPEKVVDQKLRQRSFDNYQSKDDHLMHLVAIAKDQHGTRYYKTKNSWGTDDSQFDGYLYMSEAYVRSKAVSILVAREAVPEDISDKFK